MINRKQLFVLITIISLCFLCSFTGKRTKTIIGTLGVYGNEPFLYFGIQTEKDFYIVENNQDRIFNQLFNYQGKKIKAIGMDGVNTKGEKMIYIEEFSEIK